MPTTLPKWPDTVNPSYKAMVSRMQASANAVQLQSITGQLAAKLTNNELAISLVGETYNGMITEMLAKGYTVDEVVAEVSSIEALVMKLFNEGEMSALRMNPKLLREFIAGTIRGQLNDGTIVLARGAHKVVTQCKIGWEEMEAFLSDNNIGTITQNAWNYIFGDQKDGYNRTIDALSLEAFVACWCDEALVFAGMMSSDKIMGLINVLAKSNFKLITDAEIGSFMKTSMMRLISTRLTGEDRVKAEELVRKGNFYELKSLFSRVGLKQYDNAALMTYLIRAQQYTIEKRTRAGKTGLDAMNFTEAEINFMFAAAGVATLASDTGGSIKAELSREGGNKESIYDIKTETERSRIALYDFIFAYGMEGADGVTARYGQPFTKLQDHVDWLRNNGERGFFMANWPLIRWVVPRNYYVDKAVEQAQKNEGNRATPSTIIETR